MILCTPFFSATAQSEIFGHWKVSCYLERIQGGSITFCGICATSKNDNLKFKINDFELEINEQNIKIIIDGKTTNSNYTWDRNIDAITFEYEKTNYTFKVLRSSSDSNYILKENSCGGMLLLSKK